MPVFPCANKGLCVDPSTPFTNTSAELPDQEIFVGLNFGTVIDPPLGSDFTQTSCLGICESTVSQEEADICAAQANAECTSVGTPTGTPGLDIYGNPVTIQNPRQVFGNRAQSATVLCPDGNPFVYTVAAGRFSWFSQAQADASALSFAQQQAATFILCLSDLSNPLVCSGSPYSDSITATSKHIGKGLYWDIVKGAEPPGIYSDIDASFQAGLNGFVPGNTVRFYGTCATPGQYQFTVSATDSLGDTMNKTYTIKVLGIFDVDFLPPGTVGTAYSQTLTSSATNPIYSVESGALPDGLTLDPTGVIFGTPGTPGTFYFTLGVTEAGTGVTCTTPAGMTIGGGGIQWSRLTWQAPSEEPGGGTVSLTAAGNAGSASATLPDNFDQSQGELISNNLNYTGPDANCNLHLDVNSDNSGASPNMGVTIFQDTTPIANLGWQPTGSYDLPFTVSAATNSQLYVDFTINIQTGFDSGIALSYDFTITPA